ncbi:glycosyltransferase family 33 protein [Aplosporella prunicola CBS 121167]|uniref:Chitobiosyldiphosphodolichol beta-mannosyltransferase n=1 Tax=Aplosporella prunicola CBS 121167 TaxID=1176127 RepID=A0A6A6BK08_9PEZI|nr:glycosyltransferase family 33 protein [Aplosporella prunicola CBS 121167]KAF2142891.1 glycosyltransferase family 33 protein [Aplosporella prunicola CBS 121167]
MATTAPTPLQLAASLLALLLLIYLLKPTRHTAASARASSAGRVGVQLVVLGDIGRSPRMQYHALSLARQGRVVDVVGYRESELHPQLEAHARVRVYGVPPWPRQLQPQRKLLFLALAPLKVLWQAWGLWAAVAYRTPPAKYMLVQNPPSIPTLLVARIVCSLRGTTLCIDWHNFGHSILALKLGHEHPLVRIAEKYEYAVSQSVNINFTVTEAMARFLREKHGRQHVVPLYDRPPSHFQPCRSAQDRKAGFADMAKRLGWPNENGPTRVLVSSTSWTADEDFSLLLDALAGYSGLAGTARDLPTVVAIITGKGPQKEHYLSKIRTMEAEKKLEHVRILTAWLSMEDYASLLSYADLGVSLHMSSSGVDLPMKVVDMFGAGLPVVGYRFEAWPELVKEGVNGRGFGDAGELQNLLVDLFTDEAELRKLKEGALGECEHRWDDEWDEKAGRIFI